MLPRGIFQVASTSALPHGSPRTPRDSGTFAQANDILHEVRAGWRQYVLRRQTKQPIASQRYPLDEMRLTWRRKIAHVVLGCLVSPPIAHQTTGSNQAKVPAGVRRRNRPGVRRKEEQSSIQRDQRASPVQDKGHGSLDNSWTSRHGPPSPCF